MMCLNLKKLSYEVCSGSSYRQSGGKVCVNFLDWEDPTTTFLFPILKICLICANV